MAARLCRLAAAAWLAFGAAGCSLSYQLDSLFEKSGKTETTGSITTTGVMAAAELPPETDLVFTRAAVSEALARGKDASVPWENPATGARGNVTGLAAAYTVADEECRDFLASYVSGSKQSWLRGEACRAKKGKGGWEVRAFKPWVRS